MITLLPEDLCFDPRWDVAALANCLLVADIEEWKVVEGTDANFSQYSPRYYSFVLSTARYQVEIRRQEPLLGTGRINDDYHVFIREGSTIVFKKCMDIGAYALFQAVRRARDHERRLNTDQRLERFLHRIE